MRTTRRDGPWAAVLAGGLCAAVAGCAGADDEPGDQQTVTVRGCPVYPEPLSEGTDDTYDGFPAAFFAEYCTRCHSSELTDPESRSFATRGLDWDDEGTVREHLHRIRRVVGEVNTMPPADPRPGCVERRRLIQWIDDGAP